MPFIIGIGIGIPFPDTTMAGAPVGTFNLLLSASTDSLQLSASTDLLLLSGN